jgi:BirA family transcriptional regulator, biotin operon repressor / biotin---[acetyl-CoA-carboxylase] ligase
LLPVGAMTDLDQNSIASALRTARLGARLLVVAAAPSVMDVAAEMARAGAPDGAVVIADHQTAGRGRFGRPWLAPPGTALLMAILFRPALEPALASQVTMAVALGALEVIAAHLPATVPAALKWPNDLLAGGGKIGGIIAEAQWTGDRADNIVVGLGLNVRQAADQLPSGATSFAALGIAPPDRSRFAAEVLRATDRHHVQLLTGQSLLPEWTSHLDTLNKLVAAQTPTGVVHGRAIGVASGGALTIQTADGATIDLHAADVTLANGTDLDCLPPTEAYCVKCRTARPMRDAHIQTARGRRLARGTCPVCGTTLTRFLSTDKTPSRFSDHTPQTDISTQSS